MLPHNVLRYNLIARLRFTSENVRGISTATSRSAPSTSSLPIRGGQQRQARSTSWLEEWVPGAFTETSLFPDALQSKSPTSTGRATPTDLSFLRPPPMPFVALPEPDKHGRITMVQRFRHWLKTVATERVFYERTVAQLYENDKEYDVLRKALPAGIESGGLEIAAIYGGTTLRTEGDPITFFQITRREYHLLVRHRRDRKLLWILFGQGYWRQFVISRLPIISRLVPSICKRPSDRTRQLQSLCKRYDFWRRFRKTYGFDAFIDNSTLSPFEKRKQARLHNRTYRMLWQYVVQDSLFCKLIRWKWPREKLATKFSDISVEHYRGIVADTLLIVSSLYSQSRPYRPFGASSLAKSIGIQGLCLRFAWTLILSCGFCRCARVGSVNFLPRISTSIASKSAPLVLSPLQSATWKLERIRLTKR